VRELSGQGPWSRLFASGVVGDESSAVAERGRVLAHEGAVQQVDVTVGTIAGVVEDCAVTISAARIPPRIWAAMKRYARGKSPLEEAVEGRAQSVHLEHLMNVDWEEPLVPPARALVRACTCDEEGCAHVAALAYATADELDRDPSLLLRFRGCGAEDDGAPVDDPVPAPVEVFDGDPWEAGPLPPIRDLRPLPAGAVLKRFGPSGIRVGEDDLADVLKRAYASFAASARP
jgi:uncharacterized Zn finger protein